LVRAGETYSASKLSALPSSPFVGVVASYFIMHDALTTVFGAAALLVIAGLYLVNRPNNVVGVVLALAPGEANTKNCPGIKSLIPWRRCPKGC